MSAIAAAGVLISGWFGGRLVYEQGMRVEGVSPVSGAPELKLPILVLQGADDGAIDPQATQEFYERAGSADKQFKLYPGLYHEIMNETERDTVMGDILAWLEKRG